MRSCIRQIGIVFVLMLPIGMTQSACAQFDIIDLGPVAFSSVNGLNAVGALNDRGDAALLVYLRSGREDAGAWLTNSGLLDLGFFGYSVAINNQREVIGEFPEGGSPRHAFLWRAENASLIDLGTLGGSESYATGINDHGEVAGYSTVDQVGTQHAFLWTAEVGMIDLGTLGGGNFSAAEAVNDRGDVAGFSTTASGASHLFLWTMKTGMTDLGTLGLGMFPVAMNNRGDIVGWGLVPVVDRPHRHGFFWSAETGLIDLGPAEVQFSQAVAVNNRGEVVGGFAFPFEGSHAFFWSSETGMIDLDTLGGRASFARAINDRGEVVGYSDVAGSATRHAFLWTRESGMVDLGTVVPGIVVTDAWAINRRGEILVEIIADSGQRASRGILIRSEHGESRAR